MKLTPRHRSRAAVLTAAMLAASLTGCAQGSATRAEDSSGNTVIRFMNFNASGGHEQDLQAMVTEFERRNPGIKVKTEVVPFADYFTKLQTALASGAAPDVFELNFENFGSYAAKGSLKALENVDTGLYQQPLLDAMKVDGRYMGLPSSFSTEVLIYNKKLFDAAGLDYPTDKWTWKEESAAAKKLTDKGAKVWGSLQPVSFEEFFKALAQSGGTFFDAGRTKVAFDSPEGLKAAEWLVGKPGRTMPTERDGANVPDFDIGLFKEGKLAMWHTGSWMFSTLAKAGLPFEWDVAVEPGQSHDASPLFVNPVGISAQTRNAAAARKWVDFFSGSQFASDKRIQTSWDIPATNDRKVRDAYLAIKQPANRQAVYDAVDDAVPPPTIERQAEMNDAVKKELGNAAAGRKTVKEALSDAAATVNELL